MSTGFATEIDQNAAARAEEAAASGNGDYAPLPGGKYQVAIAKIKGVEAYAKTGPNSGKKIVNIGFQVVPESPNGKGRYFWGRVPLFSAFAPNAEHPTGATAKAFWDFWERAIGVPRADIEAGKDLPANIEGRRLTVTVTVKQPDDYNPLGSNEIAFYDKEGDINVTPLGLPRVPWLDAEGKLIAGAVAAPGAPAAPGAQQAWTAPPAPGAPQAPAAPVAPPAPAAVAPAAPQAPAQAAEAPQWQPAAADVAYAGAVAGAVLGTAAATGF